MTLFELSKQYRQSAQALRERITQLQSGRKKVEDDGALRLLDERIKTLETMWREARDIAVLTEKYYDRGYRRNAKYTL